MARTFKRRRGDVLQPGRFTPAVVRGLRMKSTTFDGQYQQEPAPATGRIFNPTWWRYYKEAPEFEMVVLSVDCTFKSGKENDLVAIQKWGVVGVRSYLIERQTEHMGYIQTKAAIRSMQKHGRPASVILIEDKANGPAIVEELQADPDFGASVIAIDPQGDKVSRANAASTDVEAGSVYLPEGAEWVAAFVRTFAAFPGVRFDDDIDAASMFINWRRTRNLAYGVLDLGRQYKSGEKPLPASVEERLVARVDNYANQKKAEPKPPCPVCGPPPDGKPPATVRQGSPGNIHCNQCGCDFNDAGEVTPRPVEIVIGVNCCDRAKEVFKETQRPHANPAGGGTRCVACGKQSGRDPREPAAPGISRKEYNRRRWAIGQFAIRAPRNNKNTYGRFG
jgi:predicted phage terminase large subunit-like protein